MQHSFMESEFFTVLGSSVTLTYQSCHTVASLLPESQHKWENKVQSAVSQMHTPQQLAV